MRVLILSDLHIGEASRFSLLCPESDRKIEMEADSVLDRLIERATEGGNSIDSIIVSGDITNRSKPEEFHVASEFLSELTKRLNLTHRSIFFVPGNHDVDWPMIEFAEADTTGLRHSLRFAGFEHRHWLFAAVMKQARFGSLTDVPYFGVWTNDTVMVVGINTCSIDGPKVTPHPGCVPIETIDQLNSYLEKNREENDRIKMCIVHHHLEPRSDPGFDDVDFSVMQNASDLRDILIDHGFDLLVHGHKHVPRFKLLREGVAKPLAVLCAGSFSRSLATRWQGRVGNLFHVIEIHDRDGPNRGIRGELLSFAYVNGPGWVQSSGMFGIDHAIAFGSFEDECQIYDIIKDCLEEHKASGESIVEVKRIVGNDNRLRYYPKRDLDRVLDIIHESGAAKLHRGEGGNHILRII